MIANKVHTVHLLLPNALDYTKIPATYEILKPVPMPTLTVMYELNTELDQVWVRLVGNKYSEEEMFSTLKSFILKYILELPEVDPVLEIAGWLAVSGAHGLCNSGIVQISDELVQEIRYTCVKLIPNLASYI